MDHSCVCIPYKCITITTNCIDTSGTVNNVIVAASADRVFDSTTESHSTEYETGQQSTQLESMLGILTVCDQKLNL